MSYVNGTTHYNLPQTVGTDKRDWTDTNQAFADIDSAIHTAVETAETGATNIQALQTDVNALDTRVTSAEADIATNTTDISLINTKVNGIDADIADVRQDAQDMICAYNEATATSSRAYAIDDYFIYNDVLYKVTAPIAIGGTIVPNTNCTATNVTTEIAMINNDSMTITLTLANSQVSTVRNAILSGDLPDGDYTFSRGILTKSGVSFNLVEQDIASDGKLTICMMSASKCSRTWISIGNPANVECIEYSDSDTVPIPTTWTLHKQ